MTGKLSESRAKEIFDSNTIPEGAKASLPAFAFYAEIDTVKQLLRKIKPAEISSLSIPPGVASSAREVLIRLFRCFHKAGTVSEGLIGDLLFGFGIPTVEEPALPANVAWEGLCHLRALGYLKFQTPDGSSADPYSDQIGSAWVRYEPKLLELVYEGSSAG